MKMFELRCADFLKSAEYHANVFQISDEGKSVQIAQMRVHGELTRLGAAPPMAAERMVMAARASMALENTYPHRSLRSDIFLRIAQGVLATDLVLTVRRGFFIAMTAAMKNVLSPISDTRIMPQELKKPSTSSSGSKPIWSTCCAGWKSEAWSCQRRSKGEPFPHGSRPSVYLQDERQRIQMVVLRLWHLVELVDGHTPLAPPES